MSAEDLKRFRNIIEGTSAWIGKSMGISFRLDSTLDPRGTSKKGTLTVSYNDVVNKFGEPTRIGQGDPWAEWGIQIRIPEEDGDFEYVTAFLYSRGVGANHSQQPDEVNMFTIGGKDMDSSYYIHQIMAE